MVDNGAFCVLSARSRARIATFLVNTGLVSRTVCTKDTFWTTAYIRISLIFRYASANAVITLSVWSAWCWIAWIWNRNGRWWWFGLATSKWITSVSFRTITYRCMINYRTLSSESTRSWTRIRTFFPDTSQSANAFWVDCTLWPTVWWASYVIGDTGARWRTIKILAYWVRTARWRHAWIGYNWFNWWWWWS